MTHYSIIENYQHEFAIIITYYLLFNYYYNFFQFLTINLFEKIINNRLRALFMICTEPAPKLKNPSDHSAEFIDFLSRCLEKNPMKRANAAELLEHPFIKLAEKTTNDFLVSEQQ